MDNPTYIALSRLVAQQRSIDVLANNIANANTAGFKSARMLFSDWLSKQSGVAEPRGGSPLQFVQDRATYRQTQEGTITQTGNPLDLALQGDGYFSVQTPAGVRLTRAGQFTLRNDGTITDSDDNPLLDDGQRPIQVSPADSRLSISADGILSSENGRIARISVSSVVDPSQMKGEAAGLFNPGPSNSAPVANPHVIQGSIESSNVQPVLEMTRMMREQREFDFTSQFVQSESERQQTAIDTLTKSAS